MDLNKEKKGINILYLPTRYFPSISGAEFYIQRMAEILSKNNDNNITVSTSNAIDFRALREPQGKIINNSHKAYNQVNKVKVNRFSIDYDLTFEERIKKIKNINSYKNLNLSDTCLNEILKNGPFILELYDHFINLKEFTIDLIHVTFFPYFNLVLSLMIGNFYNIPTVCTPFYHFSNPRYLNIPSTEVLKKFSLLIACTEIEKTVLVEKIGIKKERIKVIPMGVDLKKINQLQESKLKQYSFKDKFFKRNESNHKMVLYCGYKNFEKGSISILKSIPLILKKIKKVYFVFIGPSTMAFNRELKKIQKNNDVRIINFTPANMTGYFDKKKISAFKECDLFLMPSRSDAFGIAFLEAWASNKPVIGANIGATPEVIRNNIDGLLVEFNDPKDISEKVIKLLKSRRLRNRFGSQGKMRVVSNYTWEIVANSTQEAYQKLITSIK